MGNWGRMLELVGVVYDGPMRLLWDIQINGLSKCGIAACEQKSISSIEFPLIVVID